MAKYPPNQKPKRKKQEEVIALLAKKHTTTTRYVRMVISGSTEKNFNSLKAKAILEDYMFYQQKHNLLLQEVQRVVLFNNKKVA